MQIIKHFQFDDRFKKFIEFNDIRGVGVIKAFTVKYEA